MAITVTKKKTLTVKAPTDVPAVEADAPTGVGGVAGPRSVHAVARGPSYTPYAICALVAVLMFAVLLFLQWTEWQYFADAFPVQGGPAAAGGVR